MQGDGVTHLTYRDDPQGSLNGRSNVENVGPTNPAVAGDPGGVAHAVQQLADDWLQRVDAYHVDMLAKRNAVGAEVLVL